jgi:VWFA-related protein
MNRWRTAAAVIGWRNAAAVFGWRNAAAVIGWRNAAVVMAALSLTPLAAQSTQPPPSTQAQQRPVFRGGTHFVRVDAYPVKDGRIVEGLQAGDFEIHEDGKPQAIESFDFVRFDTFTPEALRVEPRTQREGFDMAADPRNRVFVIVVDLPAVPMGAGVRTDIKFIEQPLVNFLDRVLGPQDLYGFLTSRNSAKDLVLARKTTAVKAQILDMFRTVNMERDEADDALDPCPNAQPLKSRYRADQLYTSLETLVQQLAAIRQERKSVIFVANGLTRATANLKALELNAGQMPKIGITSGRVGIGNRDSPFTGNTVFCTSEVQRLASLDFDERYRRLLADARSGNVSFYVITPEGLTGRGPSQDLIALAHETDAIAIVNTNDLNGGMKRIADDLAAYYVLGYYTTNTKFDGGLRNIKVRYKANGGSIRARRQYRAPTQAEIAALSAPPPSVSTASAASAAPAAITLVQKPRAYLVRPKAELAPADVLRLTRTDRLRVEWIVAGALDQRAARILDRTGKPLPFDVPLADNEAARTLTVELPLAPFARGDYSVELTVGSGSIVERSLLAFRVQ